jgi:hypothetical protein
MLIQWFGSIAGYLDASKKGADQKKKTQKNKPKKARGKKNPVPISGRRQLPASKNSAGTFDCEHKKNRCARNLGPLYRADQK